MSFDTFSKKIGWHFRELIKTFSSEPSFYSSKRIERAIIFINALIGLDIGLWYLMVHQKLDWTAVVGIYTAQMIYAGYQTQRMHVDKKQEQNA